MQQYKTPEFEIISFELEDIITASMAISSGDNETSVPREWWD